MPVTIFFKLKGFVVVVLFCFVFDPPGISPLGPAKGGWALASQRWLEVNDLGRL